MEKYYITFRSVTFAQKGQRILEQREIFSRMQRTPRWMEKRGCGYALEVRDLSDTVEALKNGGAVWQKIYRVQEGKVLEVENFDLS